MNDDDDFVLDDLHPCIPDGDHYVGRCTSYRRPAERFNKIKVDLQFALVKPDVRLPAYLNWLAKKNRRVPPRSKAGRWFVMIADFTGKSPRSIRLRDLTEFWFQVKVYTSTHADKQQPYPDALHQSKVGEIVAVLARIQDGVPPPEPRPIRRPVTAGAMFSGYPDVIEGLGRRRKDASDRCQVCGILTPFAYGVARLCMTHAKQAKEEQVR